MTLIKFNQIAQASGKMNGTVFTRNASGQYMKTLQKPINKKSSLQDTQRTLIASLTRNWGLLSEVQRNGWRDLALQLPKLNRVGVLILRSGFNVFVEFNVNLRSIGVYTLMDTAPAKPVFSYEIATVSLTLISGSTHLYADVALTEALPVNTQWFVLFRSTGIISVGRTAINGILKILAVAEGVDESDELSYDLISDFNTRYGRLPLLMTA